MATINSKITASKGLIGILCLTTCLLISVLQVGAETSKSRLVYRLAKVEMMEVGDAPGHVMGVMELRGLSFENGEVGTYSGLITIDYTSGSGKHEGYGVVTFEDGSTQVTKSQGTTKASEGGKISLFEGTFTYSDYRVK